MNITEITKKAGAHKKRKRVGRGESSGHGKTSGRGHKGAGQRSGTSGRVLAEGGMFPLFRRLPKFGFSNVQFRTEYQIVNVGDLEARFDDGGHVTAATLEAAGLVRSAKDRVKILGDGELKKKLKVEAHRLSASAVKKIEAAGGTITRIGPQPKKKFIKRPKEAAVEAAPKEKKEKKSKKGDAAPKAEKKPKGESQQEDAGE